METKTCNTCKEHLPITEFYSRKARSNKPYDKCKKCFNQYTTNRWIEKKISSIIYKGSKCLDCELSFPNEPYVIFDFHHRDPNEKNFDWHKLRLRSDDSIKLELDKCDLLCSNCHRKRHHFLLVVPGGIEPPMED